MTGARDIEAIAARWVLRREEPDWSDKDQRLLDAWLEEALAHKAAYWRLEHGWRAADRIAALGDVAGPTPRRRRISYWVPAALAASLLIVVGADIVSERLARRPGMVPIQLVLTEVGARKALPLADGSRIELNTATRLRTRISAGHREVWLDRGEAYFEVRHSDHMPFVVHAGPKTITVLGTKFAIRREGEKVTVSVVEGRVRVDQTGTGARPASSLTVVTGDVAIADSLSTLVAIKAPGKVEESMAWRRGMLSFEQSSLAEAASEFNRYNRRKLVVEDPEAASIRIGGTFQAANVDAFARLLSDAYGLEIERSGEEIRVSR